MRQKIKCRAKHSIFAEEDSKEILDIAKKRGIKTPSTHLGFFKTVYAQIEEPNLNRIRLGAEAVQKALPGLIGSQVNFEHLGAGFLCGTILDAWINEIEEIEVVYSFYKSIYPDEYERSIELAKEGQLAVSFELLAERESQEFLEDGTIRLNDIDFQGMGHLMDNPPACPKARIYEFASKCKERLSTIDERDLVFASEIENRCDEILNADKWTSDIYNNFPNSSFAVIEPAFLDGTCSDLQARHLPFKDRDGKIELTNYRIAIDKVNDILPITDSITEEELRKQAKEELDKYTDILANQNDESKQGGNSNVTEKQKAKIQELRAELGDFAKDISDEDLLDDAVVAEIRKEKEAEASEKTEETPSEKAEENKEAEKEEAKSEEEKKAEELAMKIDSVEIRTFSLEEKDGVQEVVESVTIMTTTDYNAMQEAVEKVAELQKSLEAKDSEIETVRANAEKIGTLKVQLKDNEFAKDFTDEDYLDDEKVTKVIKDKENAEIISTRKEELKDNDYAKDFSDEDYLNEDKVELAKVKKEKDELEATKSKEQEELTASEEKSEDMETGSADDDSEGSYGTIMASIRKENTEKRETQKVYTKK